MTEAIGTAKILLIDDDADDAFILNELVEDVRDTHYRLTHVSSYEAGLRALQSEHFDACLLDYRLGAQSGLDLLSDAKGLGIECPIILLTGFGNVETDIEAMERGAADYLIKDRLTSEQLSRSLRYSIKRAYDIANLRERTENFKTLFNSTFEGILVHRDGIVLDANAACSEIFSVRAEQMIGKPLSSFFKTDEVDFIEKSFSATIGNGHQIVGKRGEGDASLEIFSRRATLGGQPTIITAVQDLTHRKLLEAQVLQQDRLASLGVLASSLAHEIGTPLGVIRGRAEMLSAIVPEPNRKNVDVIITQIDRITKLMSSVLQLARGKQTDTVTDVDVGDVLDDIVHLLSHELQKKGITFVSELPEVCRVRAEPGPLGQVFLNLMVNAIHAIEEARSKGNGGADHRIRISCSETPNAFEVGVHDTGGGIPQSVMNDLFKPFFTTKGIGSGTGLGLPISLKIVQSWGGTIRASNSQSGAVFTICLPKVVPRDTSPR